MTIVAVFLCTLLNPHAPTVSYEKALSVAKAQAAKKPNDGQARFTLGRILLIGYVDQPETLDAVIDEDKGLVTFAEDASVMVPRPEGELSSVAGARLKEAVGHLNRAARINANNAQYALACGWGFEHLAWQWKNVIGSESFAGVSDESDAWAKVSADYRRAYSMAKDQDAVQARKLVGNRAFNSVIAARNLLRLADQGKARVTDAERKRLSDHIAKFKTW